jgi:hypothetical protein
VNLTQLKALFVKAGCVSLYAKPLAENDNSKNQVYFGPGFQALNLFPNEGIVPDSSPKNPIFKAKLRFGWLLPNGQVAEAPKAQLILYPQYPEVRFSGFLQGCKNAPSDLMAGRIKGRVLFIGATADKRILGFAVRADSQLAAEFGALGLVPTLGVFTELELPRISGGEDSRRRLLAELKRIHDMGWIDSRQLDSSGIFKPCLAQNCGGFTLEAEFGIPKNSQSEPDFLGWEIKQHGVTNFDRPASSASITLMTPEPNRGFYQEHGMAEFVRKYGYPDRKGREDRLNFGGVHRVGERHTTTKLVLMTEGYDAVRDLITDANGCVALVSESGEMAAGWAFNRLFEHWSRKHAKAAYVPSQCRTEPQRQYAYGHKIRLAQGTDSLRLLKALASGSVFYDPGIKLEGASSDAPHSKPRSQFRIASKNIGALYETLELVEL